MEPSRNALARQFSTASLLRFALPNMVMMVFMSLYTIVDGMFISRYVGTLALSAVNMSYPLTSLVLAIGVMLGTGGSAVIARKLGEGKAEEARQDLSCIVAVTVAASVVFLAVCLGFLDPILRLLGTSQAQFPYCRTYTMILVSFAPASFLQSVFQVLFVTAGKPELGLGVTVAGGLANIVLDWFFMGPLGMGVEGAAIATVISYCIPAVSGLVFFFWNRRGSLYFTAFRPRWRMLLQVCGNGSSEMVSNIANAITTLLFNLIFMEFWQEDGVASITIVMYFQFVFSAIYLGFSMGVAPVISYKYGAQDIEQLRKIVKSCLRFIVVCALGVYVLSQIVIRPCLTLFTDADSAVYSITLGGFPIYAASFLLMGVGIFASSLFTAFSNGVVSAVISFARTLVFLVGMLLTLPALLGEIGIWLAVPAAETLGLAVAAGFLLWGRGKYGYGKPAGTKGSPR